MALAKTLFIIRDGLSPVLLLTGVFHMLKTVMPDNELHVACVSEAQKELLRLDPYIDEFVSIEDSDMNTKEMAKSLNIYSHIIIDRGDKLHKTILAGSLKSYGGTKFKINKPEASQSYAANVRSFLSEKLKIEDRRTTQRVYLSDAERLEGKEALRTLVAGDGPVALVSLGNGGILGHLPAGEALMVCRALGEEGYSPVLVDGSKLPGSHAGAVVQEEFPVFIPNDLRTMAKVTAAAALMVAPEGFNAHLAAALAVPLIMLYGPGNLGYGPEGEKFIIVQKSAGCTAKGDAEWCTRCAHKDYVDDGAHPAACMYWFKERDVKAVLKKLTEG